MIGLIKADLTDIIKKKRFMILMALAFLGALIMTIVVKVKLWNDQTFFFGMERYIFYGFNLAIGIILLISVYHRKFIRYSIQMVEEREQKRFCGVLSRFLSGILILMAGYVLMTLFMLLLGVIFGAGCSSEEISALILRMSLDCLAAMASYSMALFFLYLIPFPFVPVLIYGALMFIAPYILRIPNVYPSGLYRMAGLLTPKVGANVAYTRIRLSGPFFEFIATVLIYLLVSLLLSILVFHFKKRKAAKKKLVADALITALLMSMAGCGSAKPGGEQPGHGKWINSIIPENIERCAEQRLQDDFAASANAEWNASQNFDPADAYGTFADSRKLIVEQLLDIINDPLVQSPNAERLKAYYGLYADWEYRNQLGIEPLRTYLGYIDEIQSVEDVYRYMTDSSKNPFAAMLFQVSTVQTDHYSLVIDQPDYSLKKSNRYVSLGDEGIQQKEKITDAVHYLMERLGCTEEEADTLLDQCFGFELKMAELSPGGEGFLDHFTEIPLSEVVREAGDFPIQRILEHFGLDQFRGYCADKDHLTGLSKVCTEENLDGIKAFFKIYLMRKSVVYLDQECYLRQKEISLDKTNPYAEVVVYPINYSFYSELSDSPLSGLRDQVYLDRYYDEEVKKEIESMCKDFIRVYHDLIMEKDWLSEENKKRILEKLDAMHFMIMKPNNVADYSGISIKPKESGGSILEAYCEINRFNLENMGRLSKEKIDRDYWNIYDSGASTTAVNSVYDPNRNVFVIDIGALTGDFYSKDMSYEEKLGRIGCVIGHELSHAFDSSGVNYDSEGKRNALLTGDDMSVFNEKADKVREYFGRARFGDIPYYYDGTVDISGEAIADMGGMKSALRLAKKVEGFDYDTFFRSYASLWKRLQSKSDCAELIRTDGHPLSFLRTNITLQQFDEFYETYGIQPGDGMYLAPEDRIAVW